MEKKVAEESGDKLVPSPSKSSSAKAVAVIEKDKDGKRLMTLEAMTRDLAEQ